MCTYTATYSPDDNKIRLYASSRLDRETYDRVRAAGFIWAPKQDLFVAPMWTPERADLAIELAGEIEDEDKSLCERADDRAERFEEYQGKRADDAARAHAAVDRIAGGIPMGQPILVGHHSERHARKDAERIENGMRKAIRMWETSQYWERRAKGALFHAKYKERPDVRARRIKGLEADRRKHERDRKDSETFAALWTKLEGERLTAEACHKIGNFDHWGCGVELWYQIERSEKTPAEARELAMSKHAARMTRADRWIAHIDLRLGYERAMLGPVAEAPKVKRSLPTMANYPGEGFEHMTKADYARIHRDYKGTRMVRGCRVRSAVIKGGLSAVYLTDSKRIDPPEEGADDVPRFKPIPHHDPVARAPYVAPAPTAFDAMKQQLRAGVQVVSAPQLFPTPPELAARMVEAAGVKAGYLVLEPSAGTGNIVRALLAVGAKVRAVEINGALAGAVERACGQFVHLEDFLSLTLDRFDHDHVGFDAVVMNPPFADGADVEHVAHALGFLRPGGRLVAVMSAGFRFRSDSRTAALRAIVETFGTVEDLPDDSFKSSGTSVRTVLVTFTKPEAAARAAVGQ